MKPLNLFLGIAFACAAFGCSANSPKSDAVAAAADTVANRSEAVISTIMGAAAYASISRSRLTATR